MSIKKIMISVISVGFYFAMIIMIFNKCPEPLNDTVFIKLGLLPQINIYQHYIENMALASIFSIMFNAFCARLELESKWYDSDFFDNRWTFIYIALLYSGAVLYFLMIFVENSLVLWRIYQIINFLLFIFLDLDKTEFLFNYFSRDR